MSKKVKMLRTEHYRDEKGIWHHLRPGNVYDVPDFLAEAWCDRTQPVAERVKQPKKVEKDGHK